MKSLLKLTLLGLLTTLGLAQEPIKPAIEEKKETPKESKEFTVLMSTSLGDIHIELDPKNAPKTVENFLKYVDAKYYNGTIFHRVIKGFMVQGGGFKIEADTLKKQQTNAPVKNESEQTAPNTIGTIAMARTSAPHSATAQFFINVANNDGLNYPKNGGGYATFGKVTKGMDIVQKIESQKTGRKNGMADVPEKTITIKSVTRLK